MLKLDRLEQLTEKSREAVALIYLVKSLEKWSNIDIRSNIDLIYLIKYQL